MLNFVSTYTKTNALRERERGAENLTILLSCICYRDLFLVMSVLQSVPPTTWYRLVAGLNAQLRLVRRGRLRATFRPVLRWLESYANPALQNYSIRVDLAWFQATACGYCHYGLLVYAIEEETNWMPIGSVDGAIRTGQQPR